METSLFTGAIPTQVRNSQTSRFFSMPGKNPGRSSRGGMLAYIAHAWRPVSRDIVSPIRLYGDELIYPRMESIGIEYPLKLDIKHKMLMLII